MIFGHILLATNFSGASEHALGVAADLTPARGGRLTVLHVYEASASALADTAPGAAERTWPGGRRARRALDAVVDRLRARGLQADGALRFGAVAEEIVDVAHWQDIDLIVLGAGRRRGRLAHLWYGSTAERVVRDATVPVLAVPVPAAPVAADQDNVVRFRRR